MRTLGAFNLVLVANAGAFAALSTAGPSVMLASVASAVTIGLSLWAVGLAQQAHGRRLWAGLAVAACALGLVANLARPLAHSYGVTLQLVSLQPAERLLSALSHAIPTH